MNLSVEDGRITLSKPDESTCRVEVKNVGPKDEGLWKITLDSGLGVERDLEEYVHQVTVELPSKFIWDV